MAQIFPHSHFFTKCECGKLLLGLFPNKTAFVAADAEFFAVVYFRIANDTRLYSKLLRNSDNIGGGVFVGIKLHAMPHIEYLVHFRPIGIAFFLNEAEKWRHIEHPNALIDGFKALLVRVETTGRNWKSMHFIAFIVIFMRKIKKLENSNNFTTSKTNLTKDQERDSVI
jgi:hypothetical protein